MKDTKSKFEACLFVLLCAVFKFYSVTYFIYAPVVKFKSALIKAKNFYLFGGYI